MESVLRYSPMDLGPATDSEIRQGWQVALTFDNQAHTRLIDLSHAAKWDLQGKDLARFTPFGLEIPARPGQCAWKGGMLINRMNRTQCSIWHLAGKLPEPPAEPGYTDLTDGLALVAVCGRETLAVLERVSNLDLAAPGLEPPCLLQGPVLHIPCQVVLLGRKAASTTVLMAFSRGYGQAMADALLKAGRDLGLAPGGLDDFDLKG